MGLSLSEMIMYNVLHISMLNSEQQQTGSATGFIFGFCNDDSGRVNCLVTNRHVLTNCVYVKVTFTRKNADGMPDVGNLVSITLPTTSAICHPNPDIDLAILPVSGGIDALERSGADPFFVFFDVSQIPPKDTWTKYSAIENVFMAGYPKGFHDTVNSQPIFRSGITATHPALDFDGAPEFLVDMPCFEGCSGSPVFICDEGLHIDKKTSSVSTGNKFELLGVQYAIPNKKSIGQLAIIPTDSKSVPVVPLYLNLGYIIKSTELLAFEDIIRAKLNP